jgi:thiol-disulfide isomerase/thioredoxin
MKYLLFSLSFLCLFYACNPSNQTSSEHSLEGLWVGKLQINHEKTINFNFRVDSVRGNKGFLSVINAEEIIPCVANVSADSLWFSLPVFDAHFSVGYSPDSLSGVLKVISKDRKQPFTGHKVSAINNRGYGAHDFNQAFNGKWRANFADGGDFADAIGVFSIGEQLASGTFLTETGDYRFLQGSTMSDTLYLSCFDGAHAFLFTAYFDNDTLRGEFFSGPSYKDTWWAVKDDAFELRSPESLTQYIGDSSALSFSFPDLEKNTFVFPNDVYKNKIVLIQILGSWCPNCKDEVAYFSSLKKQYSDLEVIGLCFEVQKDLDGKIAQVKRLKQHFNIDYPLLIAGSASKKESAEKLPFLNHIVSYPTTIVIDKTGKVRKVHTGFYGPSTGKYYEDFKKEFEAFLNVILNE